MNDHVIITISRQFGSNGREIGRLLAEYLDIGYYNKEIMKHIAQQIGITPDFFEEDNRNELGFFSLSNRNRSLANMTELSLNAQVYDKACELIQAISEMESAVIVGRCADYILKDDPNCIRIYIYSDIEERIQRSIREYNVPVKKAQKFVSQQDVRRSGFYEFYTNQTWGDPKNYDIMINTSHMSEWEVVEMIAALYDKRKGVVSFKGAFMNQYIQDKSIT